MGSKARENANAMNPAFVLLDFQHAGVRRIAQCTRRSADIHQFRSKQNQNHLYHCIQVGSGRPTRGADELSSFRWKIAVFNSKFLPFYVIKSQN